MERTRQSMMRWTPPHSWRYADMVDGAFHTKDDTLVRAL